MAPPWRRPDRCRSPALRPGGRSRQGDGGRSRASPSPRGRRHPLRSCAGVGRPEAAAQIAFGMQDGRRRWIAGLRAGAADPKDLEPARLYEIVAQTGALETELSGLSALLGPPAIQGCWIGFRTTGWT